MNEDKWIVYDGSLIPNDRPVLPAESRGIMYGDGCFETMRSYSGSFLKPEAHFERLARGIEYLKFNSPFERGMEDLHESISDLLRKNKLDQGDSIVRVQVWREGGRGYDISGEFTSHYAVTVNPLPDVQDEISLVTVSTRRIPGSALRSDLKLSNGINYIRATAEARKKGGDDALMQTVDGWISETPVANLFWVNGNTVCTPSADCDLLPGITRSIIIELIRKHATWTLDTGQFELNELNAAESCFTCNSVREIIPVNRVNDYTFNTGHPVVEELKKDFQTFRNRLLTDLFSSRD